MNRVQGNSAQGLLVRHFLSALVWLTLSLTGQASSLMHVAPGGLDGNDGLSWDHPKQTVQAGVDAVAIGGTVLVSNGVYDVGGRTVAGGLLTNRVVIYKPVTVQSVNGPASTTILGAGPRGDSAVRCVWITNGAALVGFTLTNGATRISGSSTDADGGGVWAQSAAATLRNCIITGNSALSGGGVLNGTLYDCALSGNSALSWGGGAQSSVLNGCTLADNSAFEGGGAIFATLNNCLVTGNSARNSGGGVFGGTLNNCTLSGNGSVVDGGGSKYGTLYNCIVYFNTNAASGAVDNYLSGTFNYSCTTPLPAGSGNIGASPEFVSASDFRLKSISPCINRGITANAPGTTDLFGLPRVLNGRVDMGAYEMPAYPYGTFYVNPNSANPTYPYIDWLTAARTIQDAVDAAWGGQLIMVYDGIYASGGRTAPGGALTNRVVIDSAVTLQSFNGASKTWIVGAGPLGDNAVRCVWMTYGATLSGFTLTNGATRNSGNDADLNGGGLWAASDTVSVSNCVFTGNTAVYGGGAIGGTLNTCTLSGNTAFNWGGGARSSVLNGCTLEHNTAFEGGGSFLATLNNCLVTGNSARNTGGGVWGGTLNNCTLSGNGSAVDGGGSKFGTLNNCIVYFNTNAASGAVDNYLSGTFNYSCTTPLPAGSGNISSNPGFISASDFRLTPASPCINRGDNANAPGASDLAGRPRVLDGRVDMGAFETSSYPVGTRFVNSGSGNPVYPYTDWLTAARTIQDAVDAASNQDLVVVSDGIYATGGRATGGASLVNRVVIDKPITVQSVNGAGNTWIEGVGPRGESAVRCVWMTNGATLVGFTLTNGATRASGVGINSYGGGLWAQSSAAVVSNCVFTGNAAFEGGGAFSGTLGSCTLIGNTALNWAGGARNSLLNECALLNNSAFVGGGAIHSTLNNCTLNGNTARHSGGGTWDSTLYNCTVIGNSADVQGGGSAHGTLNNTIVYSNTNTSGAVDNYVGGTFSYSCSTPLPVGSGNIADPPLLGPLADNGGLTMTMALLPGSPAIDAGVKNGLTTDQRGRFRDDYPDMGAYEALSADRFEPNDSLGSATPFGPLRYRREEGLTVHSASNPDYYRFTADVDGTLTVRADFIHARGDLDLMVYDAASNVVGQSSSVTDSESVSLPCQSGHEFIARVYGFADATHPLYGLTFSIADRFEPNNTQVEAADWPVPYGTLLTGLTLLASDYDFFTLIAAEAGRFSVTAHFAHAEGDVDLDAWDAHGRRVASSVSASDDEALVFNAESNGVYWVRLYGYLGQINPMVSLSVSFSDGVDTDNDGIPDSLDPDDDDDDLPDEWEIVYGLDPLSAAPPFGRDDDIDGDGLTNYEEWLAGSHPRQNDLIDNVWNPVFGVFIADRFLPAAYGGGLLKYRLMLHDIDLDGDQDIITPGLNALQLYRPDEGWYEVFLKETAYLFLFENQGSARAPQWGTPRQLELTDPDSYVFDFADIDADGDSDYFSFTSNAVKFVRNTGSVDRAQWAPAITPYMGIRTEDSNETDRECINSGLRLTDMDGDGDFDILLGARDNVLQRPFLSCDREGLWMLENTGSVFQAAFATNRMQIDLQMPPGNWIGSFFGPETIDIDADGDTDLILGVTDTNSTEWVTQALAFFENTGGVSTVSFAVGQLHFPYGTNLVSSEGLGDFAVSDLDGDEDADILYANWFDFSISANTGTVQSAEFTSPDLLSVNLMISGVWAQPTLVDIDADGDQDMFIGYWDVPYGTVRPGLGVEFYENAGSPNTPVWEAPDRDYFNTPYEQVIINYGSAAHIPQSLTPALVDMDGDQDFDVLLSKPINTENFAFNGEIFWRENEGTPTQPAWSTNDVLFYATPTLNPLYSAAAGDLDNDGDVDLVCISATVEYSGLINGIYTAMQMQLVERRSAALPAVWEPAVDLARFQGGSLYDSPGFVSLVDYNEDGRLDILLSRPGARPEERIQIFLNTGNLTFNTVVNSPNMVDFDAGRVVVRDLDADGDFDLVSGDKLGGIRVRRNARPKLTVAPLNTTLSAGDTLMLSVSGQASNAVVWSFSANASGASLSNGTYTAGSTGGVDIVEAMDGVNGVSGRAFVNVVSAEDITTVGKAVIIAGAKSGNDPVWFATDRLAQKAYKVLRLKGYTPDNISYLSFDPNRAVDVDGNGLVDDIDGTASLASVEAALTTGIAGAERVFVFMCDHGSDAGGQAFMRLNADEALPITSLDQWLDAYQNATTGQVVVVADFCYAGSILDELTYTGPAERVVIASTAADELTYFIAGGLISFSEVFFSAVLQNMDLQQAFRLAADAMGTYQQAQMDTDGSGDYFPPADSVVAKKNNIGASAVYGQDMPQIGLVSPNKRIDGAETVTLWVDDISSAYPVERVWCVIVPPNHAPDLNSGNPITDLPERDLIRNPLTQRYETEFSGFSEQGAYAVIFFAQDIWGATSFPKQSYIIQSGVDERAILLAGSIDRNTQLSAHNAYATFLARRFTDDSIYYLSADTLRDWDLDGTNEIDALPSEAALSWAITNWASGAEQLTVYLIGEGISNQLEVADGERLAPDDLDGWLDHAQVSNTAVNLVMDFDGSGGYISGVLPPPGRTRITLSSTGRNRKSLTVADGRVSFSQYFLSGILQGRTIGQAMTVARKTLRRASGRVRQRAEIDDNGNGISNEKSVDGAVAATAYIGAAFVTGDDIPQVTATVPPTTLFGTNALTVWARANDVDGISNVWVEITPPNFDGSFEPTRIDLPFVAGQARHEAGIDLFTLSGLYALTFYARDTKGVLSPAVQSTVTVAPPANQPDPYEVDDTSAQASTYNIAQTHAFHHSNDVDWVRVYMLSNFVYDIETVHHGTGIDTVLEVYRETAIGVLSLIDVVDEFGFDEGELTGLDFPSDGWYFIKVSSIVEHTFVPDTYTLIVDIPAGDGSYLVMALTLGGEAMPAGTLLSINGGDAIPFNGQKTMPVSLPAGGHVIRITAPAGFHAVESSELAGQVANPVNAVFGNPRQLQAEGVTLGASGFAVFAFFPFATVSGSVRDAWSGRWLHDARMSFTPATGPLAGSALDRFPWAASYAQPWGSTEGGEFPTNLFLHSGSAYTLHLERQGYVSVAVTNVIGAPAVDPGRHVALGAYSMMPIDHDGNGIPDAWEQVYFSTNVNPNSDSDGDGMRNRDEYRVGTDPTNAASVLSGEIMGSGTNGFVLQWGVVPGVAYDVRCGPQLLPSALQRVFGPVTAALGQSTMQWTDTGTASSSNRFYRIGVSLP